MDKKELILSLKKDFPKFNIDEDNLNDFIRIKEELENCKNCKGLGECKNSFVGQVLTPVDNNGIYSFKSQMCEYSKKNKENKKGLFKTKYISDSMLSASLDDFKTSNVQRKKAYNYAVNFVTAMKNKEYMKGLNVRGGFGSGKTYFLAGLANKLAKNGINVFMIYFPDLAREIKGMVYKDELEELINELKSVDVLILDDLGGENLNSFLRDDVLGPILNYRLNDNAPVFISTNLNLDELKEHFSQTKEEAYSHSTDDIKSYRIMRRINELTVCCDFKDYVYKSVDKD